MREHWNAKQIREETESKMSEFKTGQRVHVEFDGTVPPYMGGTEARVLINGSYQHWLNPVNLKVTALDPANWPPQAGDIWSTIDGENGSETEWFARRARRAKGSDDCLILVSEYGPANVAEDVLKLNPTLVRRRDEAPTRTAPSLLAPDGLPW